MKLVIREPESSEAANFMASAERIVSSEITEVEVLRVAAREEGERGVELATQLMGRVSLIELDRQARTRAASLKPAQLRSLDAIHLATALGLNLGDLVFVGYDRQLQEAAAAAGLETASPGT